MSSLTDSAGQPWAGRSFQADTRFAQDDGSTPAQLAEVLEEFKAGAAGQAEVLSELAKSRVLIPLLAVAGDEGYTDAGLKVDKTQELSIVTVSAPDGRRVLPVFSSVADMQSWNKEARPIPVSCQQAALSVVEEGSELMVLNPGSDSEFVVRRPMVWAAAQGLDWTPAWEDNEVLATFAKAAEQESSVVGLSLAPADPKAKFESVELEVTLALEPGLAQAQVAELSSRLSQAWSAEVTIAERVDSLKLRLVAAY